MGPDQTGAGPPSEDPTEPPTTAQDGHRTGRQAGRSTGKATRYLAIEGARRRGEITHDTLWLRYFALTGEAGPLEIEAYLEGLIPLSPAQQRVLTQALHECLAEQTPGRDEDDQDPPEQPESSDG